MCSLLSSILINGIKNTVENHCIIEIILIIGVPGQTGRNISY